MNNIGQFGDLPYIPNRLSPPPLAKEAPSNTTTPDNIVSVARDQFVSNPSNLGNLVASSGLVKLPKIDKNTDNTDANDFWASLAVKPETGTDANAVLPLPLNMKRPLILTESPEGGKRDVIAALMPQTTGPNASKVFEIANGLA
jgi:hypothetical protein